MVMKYIPLYVTWKSTCTTGGTLMILQENGIKRNKMIYVSYNKTWKAGLWKWFGQVFVDSWLHSDVSSSFIVWHKNVSNSEMVLLVWDVWPVYAVGMKLSFSKENRYVTNHLLLHITNYNILVNTLALFLVASWHTLVNGSISWNTPFPPTAMIG